MAVTPFSGWERAREEGGEGEKKRRRKEKRIERKWHPVKSKKVVRRTELNLSATLSEMKGDFDNIISFHLSLSSLHSSTIYIVSLRLPFVWPLLSLPPFWIWSDFLFFRKTERKRRITLRVVLLFIMKSAGVHKKTMEEKLTFYLTHQEPGN